MSFNILLVNFDHIRTATIETELVTVGYRVIRSEQQANPDLLIARFAPDLVLISGDSPAAIETVSEFRKVTRLPLMVTSRTADRITEVAALRSGADDYVEYSETAPTLILRIKRLITLHSRHRKLFAPDLDLTMDVSNRKTTIKGEDLNLTRTEFELLRIALENSHRVIDRKEFLESVWGGWMGNDHILEVHISRLRQKVKATSGQHIFTPVRGIGYRLL